MFSLVVKNVTNPKTIYRKQSYHAVMKRQTYFIGAIGVLIIVIFLLVFLIVQIKQKSTIPIAEEPEQTYCTATDRLAEACIQIYQPVCGWFDPDQIQCIKYPCAQTYSNRCEACKDTKVLYYTEGECPEN